MAANVRLVSIDYDHHGSFLTSNSRSSTLPTRILTRLLAISSAFNDMFLISGSGAMTTDSTGSATPPHMDEEGELLAGGSGRNYAAYAGPKKIC